MAAPRSEILPVNRLATVITGASLLVIVAWLVSRIWLGLDFTDEMQYYGEIASLVRTGKLFQDDLFVQQTGYLFVLPFFKLHALVFPDQSYLIVFGRLLLLAGYGAVGGLFWRAASRVGGFSRGQKLAGLAAFAAWVPFQIFAFSYNSMAYLLIVSLAAGWMGRDDAEPIRAVIVTAALLVALTLAYPPAGLGLILVAMIESARRLGRRPTLLLVTALAILSAAVAGIIRLFHGPEFLADLTAAIDFSRAFSVGATIRAPGQAAAWLILLVTSGLFLWRHQLGRAFRLSPVWRWVALTVIVAGGAGLLSLVARGAGGYLTVSACLGLLMLLATTGSDPENPPAEPGPRYSSALFDQVRSAVLVVGATALLLFGLHGETGFFATTVYLILLVHLVASGEAPDSKYPTALAVIGTAAGTIFSFTSGNGVNNFGVGAAAVIPFLVLCCPQPAGAGPGTLPRAARGLVPVALGLLLLVNGALHPYREQECWKHFEPVEGVPAFRGVRTAAMKIEAVELFRHALPPGRRVLVAGPHPWLYFVLRAEPATPMLFMHFSGSDVAYEMVAGRLFRGGAPDAILLTTARLPRPIAMQIGEWTSQAYTMDKIILPPGFITRYQSQTGYGFSPEVILLRRPPHD